MKKVQALTQTLFQRERVVFLLIGLSLLLVGYYMFLINQTVINASEERLVQGMISGLEREIADLEFAYIESESNINIDYAYSLGFKDVRDRQFVRQNTNLTLR